MRRNQQHITGHCQASSATTTRHNNNNNNRESYGQEAAQENVVAEQQKTSDLIRCSSVAAGKCQAAGFDIFHEEDRRRESAFKAVMVISLCVTVCAWASLLSICPVLYQFLNFSTAQFDGMLKFCEETAQTVSADSAFYVESFAQRQHDDRLWLEQQLEAVNRTRSRNLRQVMSPYKLHEGSDNCRCEAEPGARGTPGRKGMKGTPGARGAPGIPARLPCEPLQDLKKFCPEKCPQGLQGTPGQRGNSGDKGKTGPVGPPGKIGADGKTGARGMPGPPGVPGLDGEDGDAGTDAQPMPFVPGSPGPAGEPGDGGPPGPRGLPGIDGPQGPQGRKGAQGDGGKMGTPGLTGPPGPIGEPGVDGHKGVCPTYCAMDGGVFFVEPPEWFFKDQPKE